MFRMALRGLITGLLISGIVLAVQKIPNFRLMDVRQRVVSYQEVRGEVATIIDFWATWCKPCARFIPRLNRLYQQYQDKGVQVIGINVDGPRNQAKVQPFIESYRVAYPVLLDPNREVMSRLNVSALPTILVVDSTNKVVKMFYGYRPGDEKIIESLLLELMGDSLSNAP